MQHRLSKYHPDFDFYLKEILENDPNGRVLLLLPLAPTLQQTAATIKRIDPELHIGLYSAGLGSRETDAPVIVAGIQSVYKLDVVLDWLTELRDAAPRAKIIYSEGNHEFRLRKYLRSEAKARSNQGGAGDVRRLALFFVERKNQSPLLRHK